MHIYWVMCEINKYCWLFLWVKSWKLQSYCRKSAQTVPFLTLWLYKSVKSAIMPGAIYMIHHFKTTRITGFLERHWGAARRKPKYNGTNFTMRLQEPKKQEVKGQLKWSSCRGKFRLFCTPSSPQSPLHVCRGRHFPTTLNAVTEQVITFLPLAARLNTCGSLRLLWSGKKVIRNSTFTTGNGKHLMWS